MLPKYKQCGKRLIRENAPCADVTHHEVGVGGGLLHDALGDRGVDEGETAFLAVYGYHNAHMADGTDASPFAKEDQVSFLEVPVAGDRAAFPQLHGAVGCELIAEVLVDVAGIAGTVKLPGAACSQFVGRAQEGSCISHNVISGNAPLGRCRPGKQDGCGDEEV